MEIIDFPTENDSMIDFEIDNSVYQLRFTYNESFDYWCFSLYDDDDNCLIAMVKIVPNFPLYFFYQIDGVPSGVFAAVSDKEHIGYDDFRNGTAQFIYMTQAEYDASDEEDEAEEDSEV